MSKTFGECQTLVVSQGVLPAIEKIIEKEKAGIIMRHSAICQIADIINFYRAICHTGEEKLEAE